ncbi:two-component regulator propeller domain-containing protein [Haliscomenobacter sp.]|uniref:hybrid sensor histidine kinase/response regulator transcription factor n=1 Tax=Haliscomenobacter sp. TaxID=2717303 RepID=UPI0035936976
MQKMSTIYPRFFALFLTMLVLFLQLIPQITFAQEKYIRFERLGADQKFSASATTCIFQDSKGLIWVGGYAGLTCYDGKESTVYNYDPRDSFSISDNKVSCIAEDDKTNLWISTQNGLNYFERKTGKFYHFLDNPKTPQGIFEQDIAAVLVDKKGQVWLRTERFQLIRYDPSAKNFTRYSHPGTRKNQFHDEQVNEIYQDKNGKIWIGTDHGLSFYKSSNDSFQKTSFNSKLLNANVSVLSIGENSQGELWLGSTNGLFRFDPKTGKLNRYSLGSQNSPENVVRKMIVLEDGNLWLAGPVGLVFFHSKTGNYQRFLHDPFDPNTINQNNIFCLTKDNSGIIWIGTILGACKFNPLADRFHKIKSTSFSSIRIVAGLRSFHELSPGKLLAWGTNGLEVLDWRTQLRNPFPYRPDRDLTDWNTGVHCFFEDAQKRIWMGTLAGVFVFDPISKKFAHYKHNPADEFSLSHDYVRDIIQDKAGKIWIATWSNGVNQFDEKSQSFKRYLTDDKVNCLTRNLYNDRSGNLWVGTRGGLNRYDHERDRFIRYQHDSSDPNSMSESTAFDIYEDEQNNFWIGTYGGGLNKFNQKTKKFTHYTTRNGLIDNAIFSVLPDKKGNLWLSTFRGIVKFNPASEKFYSYTQKDGLLNESYNAFSYYQSPYTGHLFFEGLHGLDIFHPDSIRPDLVLPKIVFTDFLISNKPVNIKRDDKHANSEYQLPESISTIKKIVLPYRFKIFAFKYAATHYANPEKNQYAYKLEGFDEDWQYVGNQRQATFTNLAPGKYTLRVKASNADGIWNEKGSSIQITITPPWWSTWWAYLLYFLTVVAALVGAFRYQRERWLLQARLQMEQREAERLKEVDTLKTNLYANITHEFRTPLTAILGANDQIRIDPEKWLEPGTAMIRRNGQQLLDLINQMLDLSKLETGKMNSHWIQGDVVAYLRYIFDSFHSLAANKALEMHFLAKKESVVMDYDPEKLLRIMNNLLANAIKFTHQAGQIYLQVDQVSDLGGAVEIKLRDTGIGIAEDQLPHIFDRFYQVDDSATRGAEGTGIGLALVREMVKHLQGTLVVESEPGMGTVFTVQLPIQNTAKFLDPPSISRPELSNPELVIVEQERSDNPWVLIIEDNPDVVQYLQACLADRYQVLVAINGEEGIQKAIEMVPDAIISDVMMPIKDGFSVTAELKEHEITSHIPIILLTAKTDVESRIQGLRRGADDYLAKPFHKEELLVRLENLIATRAKLQKRYASIVQLPEPSEDINLQKEDEFIQKVRQVLEQYYTEAEFKSQQFQRAMGMGRTQLHNKLKALTNLSTTEVINQFRVQKGRVLLQTTSMNVSEVAYAVGYNGPNYFSDRYLEAFGERPSEVINRR